MPDLVKLFEPRNIIAFMLVLTRLTGLFASAPFFSTFRVPAQIKLLFAAFVAFIMFPVLSAKSGFILPKTLPQLIIFTIIEFGVGYLIGFLANLVFDAIKMAGSIISIQMAISMADVLDPTTNERTPVISTTYNYMGILVFFAIGAHVWLFEALYLSFNSIPIGTSAFLTADLVGSISTMVASIFQISFALIMPIFAVLLVTDLLLGLMAKMMPQMNIFMVSLPFKVYCGLVLMCFFILASARYMQDIIAETFNTVKNLFF